MKTVLFKCLYSASTFYLIIYSFIHYNDLGSLIIIMGCGSLKMLGRLPAYCIFGGWQELFSPLLTEESNEPPLAPTRRWLGFHHTHAVRCTGGWLARAKPHEKRPLLPRCGFSPPPGHTLAIQDRDRNQHCKGASNMTQTLRGSRDPC